MRPVEDLIWEQERDIPCHVTHPSILIHNDHYQSYSDLDPDISIQTWNPDPVMTVRLTEHLTAWY